MEQKKDSQKTAYIRKVFVIGNNGRTSSHVITIPKDFVRILNLGNQKVLVSLENNNEEDDHNESFIKIAKLDKNSPTSLTIKNTKESKKGKTLSSLPSFTTKSQNLFGFEKW